MTTPKANVSDAAVAAPPDSTSGASHRGLSMPPPTELEWLRVASNRDERLKSQSCTAGWSEGQSTLSKQL